LTVKRFDEVWSARMAPLSHPAVTSSMARGTCVSASVIIALLKIFDDEQLT
jgi:hypothetical protein